MGAMTFAREAIEALMDVPPLVHCHARVVRVVVERLMSRRVDPIGLADPLDGQREEGAPASILSRSADSAAALAAVTEMSTLRRASSEGEAWLARRSASPSTATKDLESPSNG